MIGSNTFLRCAACIGRVPAKQVLVGYCHISLGTIGRNSFAERLDTCGNAVRLFVLEDSFYSLF
jgi:hypothetical protein